MAESVKVIVRCRPVNEREERLQCDVVVSIDTDIMQIQLTKPKSDGPPKLFTFDGVYNMADTTQHIYDDICFPLVANVLEGTSFNTLIKLLNLLVQDTMVLCLPMDKLGVASLTQWWAWMIHQSRLV